LKLVELINVVPDQDTLLIFAKGQNYIKGYEGNIACAVSGGSDSDIMVDILTKLDKEKKIIYVFFDTGIEYYATKQHLDYLEKKYGIEIKRVKAKKPVPVACKEYGVPFLSKYVSEMIERLQRHGFKWEDEPYEILVQKYPECKTALKWWCNANGDGSRFNIERNKLLKEFIMRNPPDFPISMKCCSFGKKLPSKQFCKENNIELLCLGIRKYENGIRSQNIKSCFSKSCDNGKGHDEWRPIFWMDDDQKEEYRKLNDVIYSDCYVIYGLKRTGCFGCPFGSGFEDELTIIKEYEPKLYNAANKIFGKSYEYTRAYRKFKEGGTECR
jgi:3'-phosphoadenosine 5'-phosphosulfate sulfotransferase (PAPS reductase)/FAD synthetase